MILDVYVSRVRNIRLMSQMRIIGITFSLFSKKYPSGEKRARAREREMVQRNGLVLGEIR